jgi:hypothetical protein
MTILPTVREQVMQAARRRSHGSVPRAGTPVIGHLLTAVMSALAIAVAVGGLVLLGEHRSAPTSNAGSETTTRHELLQMLGVLRAPPNATNRRVIACARSLPAPPSAAFRACRRTGIPGWVLVLRRMRIGPRIYPRVRSTIEQVEARWGYPQLDPSLIRVVPIPQFDDVVKDPRGLTGTGPKPTSVASVKTHGLAIFDANPTSANGTVPGALVVPDGVGRVTLQPIRLISPPVALDPRLFGTLTRFGQRQHRRLPIPDPDRDQPPRVLRPLRRYGGGASDLVRRQRQCDPPHHHPSSTCPSIFAAKDHSRRLVGFADCSLPGEGTSAGRTRVPAGELSLNDPLEAECRDWAIPIVRRSKILLLAASAPSPKE